MKKAKAWPPNDTENPIFDIAFPHENVNSGGYFKCSVASPIAGRFEIGIICAVMRRMAAVTDRLFHHQNVGDHKLLAIGDTCGEDLSIFTIELSSIAPSERRANDAHAILSSLKRRRAS